jgi:uncharacterized protein (TIGR02265 family)
VLPRALDLVGKYCDLEQRLRDIPPSARSRGIWVKNLEGALGREQLGRYVEICGGPAAPLVWYPLGEMVARIAVAGALVTSPAEVHAGMRTLGRLQSVRFTESMLGRLLVRLLSRDPVRVLQQGAAARRQTCNYGRWEHDFSEPRRAIVHHYEEYGWLDSAILGSAEGTFEAIEVPATIELRLTDAYNGVMDIRW